MELEVKVPNLPESVSEATLVAWRKKPGDAVRRDEPLTDLETDKIVLEVPCPVDGVLKTIVVADGATVLSGQLLAIIDTSADVRAPAPAPAPEATASARGPTAQGPTAQAAEAIPSPAARKLAAERGVPLAAVQGTGKDGRITKEDVLAHPAHPAQPVPAVALSVAPAPAPAATVVTAAAGGRGERRQPMTRIRQRIAERLLSAQQNAAILTTFNEVNMAPVMALRSRYRDEFEKAHGTRLGFMAFFVRAAVEALRKYPQVNASIDGTDVVYHDYYDVGIALSAPRGLVVPVLRNADALSLADIEKAIAGYGQKARDNTLSVDDLSGGTFSITNGGVFGSMLSTPILNPPQSAILGMHNIVERPVAENGAVVIRPVMYVALSYDHRLIDGREAVQFLVAVKQAVEDPARLLLAL